ncbi:MAG: hypothetical protein ACT4TC_25205 [Myxococcaceae bacterium]
MAAVTAALLAMAAMGALRVEVKPPHAVGGSSQTAVVELIDAGGGPWEISSNVGTVSAAELGRDGIWRARFSPPPQKFPQVAILYAQKKGTSDRRWFSIPIHGTDTLKLSTKPNASVEVTVGTVSFEGVANAAGKVEVPIVAPPGVATAQVKSVDRLGNARVKNVDLEPPPFPRVRFAPQGKATASWNDTGPLVIDLYAIERNGAPSNEDILVNADRGAVVAEKNGRLIRYTAPEEIGDGRARLRANLRSSGTTDGELEISLTGGKAARLTLKANPAQYVAGSGAPLAVELVASDAKGNPLPLAGVTADFGTLTLAADGTGTLKVPDGFGERQEITFSMGGTTAKLPLVPGAPTAGTFQFERRLVRPGEPPHAGEVKLQDAYGNPVRGAALRLSAQQGEVALAEELGPGAYRVTYKAPPSGFRGEDLVTVRPEQSVLELSASLTVVPSRPAWAVAAGVMVTGSTNATKLLGGGGAGEVALTLARLPLELWIQGGVGFYREVRQERPGDAVYDLALPRIFFGLGGLRGSLALTDRWALHASVGAGVTRVRSQVSVHDSATNEEIISDDVSITLFTLRGAVGASFQFGPGRVLAEYQQSYARSPSSATVTGNLGSGSLAVGYLFQLR